MTTIGRIALFRAVICAVCFHASACWYGHPLVGVLPRAADNQDLLDFLGLALLFGASTSPGAGVDVLPVAGAVQWYRADTRSTAGSDLSLADRTGSGAVLLGQAPGAPAVLEGAVNGQPALHFDGVDDRMSRIGSFVSTNMTATVVFKPESTVSQDILLIGSLSGAGTHAALLLRDAGGYYVGCGGCGADLVSGFVMSAGSWTIFSITYDGTDLATFINGAAGAGVQRTINASSGDPGDGLYLAWNSTDSFFTGDIAEVILYDRALNTADRTAVECSVAGRYALIVNGC